MDKSFDIQSYMTRGVERIVSDALRATHRNPRESAYMARFALASRKASKKRMKAEDAGEHIPPFLIASITSRCNLHCAGCYSRCNHATNDSEPVKQLTGEKYFELFDRSRNLIPIMSIEGDREQTDKRRGEGVYDKLIGGMDEFKKRGLIFGSSVTVTTQNISKVTSESFLTGLSDRGCRAVIFVEFVPVTDDSVELAPGDEQRKYLKEKIDLLRKDHPEMVFISFPGDEKSSGGCVAAGRGFFHINSHGGAEPCPFSPYSDINVRDTSLREAMNSRLFRELRNGGYLLEDHPGGCTLYERRDEVEKIMKEVI